MKNTQFQRVLLLLVALFSFLFSAISQDAPSSFFDTPTLSKMLDHRDCAGLRFYTVLEPETEKQTTMAIAIRSDESEIFNLTNRYYIFEEVNSRGVSYNKVSQNKAVEVCQKAKDKGMNLFSASFSKENLQKLLKDSRTGGLIVKPVKESSAIVFEAQPASISAGQFQPISSSQALRSGEPCPTFCGNTINHVHMQ